MSLGRLSTIPGLQIFFRSWRRLVSVIDNERLVGMISDRHIAIRGVGLGLAPDSRVGDVMTAEVKYCYDDQELDEVSANMGEIQVRRLPVLGRDKRLVGIIALGDMRRHSQAMAPGKRSAEFPGKSEGLVRRMAASARQEEW
jgi:CBS domain-containing protein